MTGNEYKTHLSLLCSDKWIWDPGHAYSLKFYENGTGEASLITARDAMVLFIAAEFDWKPSGTTPSLAQPFEPDQNNATQFDIK
ncbi:hypothetical protein CI238_01910 [Colletotrichum incanum]|uniref:Uncharacterized protein n=1 Tax=Colletotrichum incanum TaxID=1573173 RepID=A0A161W9W9_COLIC|nr:hypothetical protein CI238_01910 [Colletotrichum incanum]OHW92667.1 hypothetical protein CSPAE12_08726 [Colletotrichum incanum]